MQNLLNDLSDVLRKDDRLIAEGQLLKNKIIELALGLDASLIRLLLTNSGIRNHFFAEVDGIFVFDKVRFQRFVSNKTFLPDSYTSFKNKIGLTSENQYITDSQEVVLSWPYKDCLLEGGQTKEDSKRDELFWNETLAPDQIDRLLSPKILTAFKRYDRNGVHEVGQIDKGENLVVKGNNLLALHTLKKKYENKIKLIYIDPPYNTGGDDNIFSYNNTFNHSTWLTFIKNRLGVAKKFLMEDGFIVLAIDHIELFYLGAIADEIFGRENRISIITVEHNPKGRNQAEFFSANSEFLLVYAKNKPIAKFNKVAIDEKVKKTFNLSDNNGMFRWEPYIRARTVWSRENKPNNWYPIYVSDDLQTITSEKTEGFHELFPTTNSGEFSWKNVRESFDSLNKDGYFKAERDNDKIVIFHKYEEQQVLKNVWIDKKYHSEFQGTNLLKELIGKTKFSYPKSLYAVQDLIKIMTKPDDTVLDFFAGSSTTAHAVLDRNNKEKSHRRFIMIEQLEDHLEVSLKRLTKVMELSASADSFVYCEIAQANQKYIDHLVKANTDEELNNIWQTMQDEAFISYRVDIKSIDLTSADFSTLELKDKKRFLMEILDKNLLYVPVSEIDDSTYAISGEDKKLNHQFQNN